MSANPFEEFIQRNNTVKGANLNSFIRDQLKGISLGKVKMLDTLGKPLKGGIRTAIQDYERKSKHKFKCKTSKQDGSVWVLRVE